MRGSVAIEVAALAVAASVAWGCVRRHAGCEPHPEAPPPPASSPRLTVERVPVPDGVTGGAIHVAAHGTVRATCWGDGAVTIRLGDTLRRVPPPGGGERFRRVAVRVGDDAVYALSSRGGLYDLGVEPPHRVDVKGIQAGARISADGWGTLGIGGESGAFHQVVPTANHRVVDDGDPSITSIAGLPAVVSFAAFAIGRADGSVTLLGGSDRLSGAFSTNVTALAAHLFARFDRRSEPWKWVVIAAGSDDGTILTWNASGPGEISLAPLDLKPLERSVGSAVVGLVVMPGDGDSAEGARVLVVHAPSALTLLRVGEPVVREALDSKAHSACAIEDDTAVLVATDAGERIVRFAR